MLTKERFAQGMTFQQYLDQMGTNKEKFVQLLQEAKIKPEDRAALDKLGKKLKVLVITEDWCGTSLVYVPFVASLLAADPTIELRVFVRDENPDVMDQYLKRGLYRSIPVFAFFDGEMNELARFIEQRPG